MTSIGALTTAFTAPTSCASSTAIHIVGCGDNCIWWAEGPLNASECYPSSYNPSLGHYYSPGVCPSGYTPACTSRRSLAQVTETIQTCCPTALDYDYGCVESIWPWQSSLGCTVYFFDSTFSFPTVTSIRDGRTVVTSTARTEVRIGVYGVEIRFQATDFVPSTATTTSTSGSSPPPTDTTAAAANSASSPASTTHSNSTGGSTGNSASNSDSSSGLSVAASAGIGVGAAIGTILLLGLGIIFGRRSLQRRRQDAETQLHAAQFDINPPPEYKSTGGTGYNTGGYYPPAPQQAPSELAGAGPPVELHGRSVLQELGGLRGLGWVERAVFLDSALPTMGLYLPYVQCLDPRTICRSVSMS